MTTTTRIPGRVLAQRLAEAQATISALLSGQIDAVIDPQTKTPVLLAKAQASLRESEERYRRIVETTSDGIGTLDTASKFTFANRRLSELLGYPADDLVGSHLSRVIGPAAVSESALAAASDEIEIAFRRNDGSELWALLKARPIVDAEGKHAGTLVMLSDRTRHREDAAALRKTEEQYRQIVEATAEGIMKVDAAARLVFVNRRLAAMLGYGAAAMLGLSVSAFMTSPGAQVVARSLEGGGARIGPVDTTFRRKDGTDLAVNVAVTALFDTEDRDVGSLAMVRDVTERKKLESQLMVSDRMASVGTLAEGIAHEINNPLAVVIANLEYVGGEAASGISRDGSSDDIQAALADAAGAAERVRLIVRDLKIFSRAPSDESTTAVNVRTLLESSLRMGWNEIRHRARLEVSYGTVPDVEADEARLGQVFLNLIVNAAQALPEGRAEAHRIDVSTRLEGQRVVVTVRDTGRGIATENLERIFDAFFTTKSVGAGTGLGLTICQRIVRDMDGEITVESVLGKGTTFRVFLPVARPAERAPRRPPAPIAIAGRRARILVVDDEPMVRQAVQRILAKSYDVILAVSAKEALAFCARGDHFDLVLCDLMMPAMSGMDLHIELKRTCASRIGRMVFMTGGAFTEPAQRFLSQLEEDHLEKPFSPAALRAIVEKYVGVEVVLDDDNPRGDGGVYGVVDV